MCVFGRPFSDRCGSHRPVPPRCVDSARHTRRSSVAGDLARAAARWHHPVVRIGGSGCRPSLGVGAVATAAVAVGDSRRRAHVCRRGGVVAADRCRKAPRCPLRACCAEWGRRRVARSVGGRQVDDDLRLFAEWVRNVQRRLDLWRRRGRDRSPVRVSLVPGAPSHFPELATVAPVPHPGADRFKLPIEPPLSRRRRSASADAIVFLDPSPELSIRQVATDEATELFWQPALPSERADLPLAWVDRLLDRPCYVLQRGTSPMAAAELLKTVAVRR
jgi:hypothetical protein